MLAVQRQRARSARYGLLQFVELRSALGTIAGRQIGMERQVALQQGSADASPANWAISKGREVISLGTQQPCCIRNWLAHVSADEIQKVLN